MKNLKITALVLAILMLFTVCALGSSESSSSPTTPNESSDNKSNDSEQSSDMARIGDVITTDYFTFTVNQAETTKNLTTDDNNGFSLPYNATEGKELLILKFSFTNTTNETHNISPSFTSSVDNVSVLPYSSAILGKIDGYMNLVGAVGAGATFNAFMVYEVPEGWESFEFEYLDAEKGTASQKVVINHSDTTAR